MAGSTGSRGPSEQPRLPGEEPVCRCCGASVCTASTDAAEEIPGQDLTVEAEALRRRRRDLRRRSLQRFGPKPRSRRWMRAASCARRTQSARHARRCRPRPL